MTASNDGIAEPLPPGFECPNCGQETKYLHNTRPHCDNERCPVFTWCSEIVDRTGSNRNSAGTNQNSGEKNEHLAGLLAPVIVLSGEARGLRDYVAAVFTTSLLVLTISWYF